MELWLPLLANRKNFGNSENGLQRHYSRCWWLIFEDWHQGFCAVFAQRLRKALIFRMDIATSMTSPFPCQSSMILSPSWGWADNFESKVYPQILKSRSGWKGRVQPGWLVMDTWGTATCTWTSRLPSTARMWWTALSPSSMSGPAVTGRTSFEDFICVTRMHTFFWCHENTESRGSISAEHGLGFKKRNFIHFSKSDSAVFLMKQIKQARKYKIKNLSNLHILVCRCLILRESWTPTKFFQISDFERYRL